MIQRALVLLALFAVIARCGEVCAAPLDDTDKLLRELADAFEKHDLKAIGARVDDGWSGLRFCASWDAAAWKAAATSLREAKRKSSSPRARVYTVTRRSTNGASSAQARDVSLRIGDEGWRLDLNSFLGPFPHM